MKIILSPAKKLKINKKVTSKKMSFDFHNESTMLISILKSMSKDDFQSMMGLSENLSNLNWLRFQNWSYENLDTYQAINMFDGDVYKGLKAEEFTKNDMKFAQSHLRILSGLYGILRPLDIILPYRLEMGTKIVSSRGKNLYDFWGFQLRNHFISQMKKDECLINLASNEYSKVLYLDELPRTVITPIFKDYKNGNLKIISFYAKKARGEMANFIIKNQLTNANELKLFNNNGYVFSHEENSQIIFTR